MKDAFNVIGIACAAGLAVGAGFTALFFWFRACFWVGEVVAAITHPFIGIGAGVAVALTTMIAFSGALQLLTDE